MEQDKRIQGYCFYDWGKSAFETSVTTAILPGWFTFLFLKANGLTTVILGAEWTADAIFSISVSVAAFIVAMMSPSFGVIADRRMIKMWWLKILTYLGAGSTILLAVAPWLGVSYQWVWLLICFIFANVGLNGAGVFYNSLLPHMGTEEQMDEISNKAFAYGYFGGGILLVAHLGLLIMTNYADWAMQAAMATSGLWWLGFAMLTFKWVPEPHIENEMDSLGIKESSKLALSEVISTLKEYKSFNTLFLYMLAYFLFIDGINSVTALAGVFGVSVLGITMFDLILTIMIIQFVAAPAAIGFTKLAEKWSTKKALQFSLVCWCAVIIGALSFAPLVPDTHEEFGLQATWDEDEGHYTLVADNAPEIAQDPDDEEQDWALEHLDVLPLKLNKYITTGATYQWSDGANVTDLVALQALIDSISDTRFSMSISGGELDGERNIGEGHPTTLGDGYIDFVPQTARDWVWEPLGISVTIQFLILGALAGALLGGSQGLSRSLFGQMVPETRSAEFFGFFGFFGKVAALIGPLLYGLMTTMFDSRVGIFSISLLIVGGAILLRRIDVEDGIAVAKAEDERNRSTSGE
ncbi:MAG: MFS transporter [Candidatus Poseidoniaceae archaeon]|jgi:UMF1 family MFS transporter|nr:MFS transporter [Candidatus Poseidoniaceae archaeon]